MQPDERDWNPLNSDELRSKVDAILETMCFVIADPIDSADIIPDAESPSAKAWISFGTDAEEGVLELIAGEDFLLEAASGLLGIEPDELNPELDPGETLMELANIIGGEVVGVLGAEDTTYKMGLPSSTPKEIADAREETDLGFDSMGSSFQVLVKRRSIAA